MTVLEKKGRVHELRVAWIGDGKQTWPTPGSRPPRSWGSIWFWPAQRAMNRKRKSFEGSRNIRIVADPREAVSEPTYQPDVWTTWAGCRAGKNGFAIFMASRSTTALIRFAKSDAIACTACRSTGVKRSRSPVLGAHICLCLTRGKTRCTFHQALLEWLIPAS